MINNRKPASLIGFYLLLVYVLLQFVWWSYLMLELNTEITRLKSEVVLLKSGSVEETLKAEKELHSVLNKKRFMIIGEGSVFLIILLFGIVRVRKTFQKETQLALQQSNFLLSVTHELKSPIASARLQLETLLIRDIDKVKQREILVNAISDTDRLNALVENILVAAQIDKSNFVLHRQTVNVSQYITQLLARPGIAGDHKLHSVIQPDIFMEIDNINFASIVLNLIDNACKYSSAGSKITVELKKTDRKIYLNVMDEGKGISDEEKKRVFEKFYRVGDEKTRTSKGTGLGLYIVNYLVQQHGGTIKILDNKPKGTVFQVEF
ncbi:MAG: GHKL domain-containing protein [Bacteroidia bacterium]|nr:GHKL domain-containing protein [Bacteroidia bacterium]